MGVIRREIGCGSCPPDGSQKGQPSPSTVFLLPRLRSRLKLSSGGIYQSSPPFPWEPTRGPPRCCLHPSEGSLLGAPSLPPSPSTRGKFAGDSSRRVSSSPPAGGSYLRPLEVLTSVSVSDRKKPRSSPRSPPALGTLVSGAGYSFRSERLTTPSATNASPVSAPAFECFAREHLDSEHRSPECLGSKHLELESLGSAIGQAARTAASPLSL